MRRFRIAVIPAIILFVAFAGCENRDKALFEEAQTKWLNGDYRAAESKLMVLYVEYPKSSFAIKALFRLGEIYYLDLDDPHKALDYFIRVTEQKKSGELDLKARDYIADIYGNSLRNYDLAILQYQKLINDYQGRIKEDSYRYRIAESYFHKGDYTQAEIEYQSLLEKFPDSGLKMDARYQIANCKFIEGNASTAIKLFQGLLKDFPKSKYEYDIRLGVAICYEELFQLEKAMKEYKELLKQYPDKAILKRKMDSIKQRLDKKLNR